jgi:hypothetical protein
MMNVKTRADSRVILDRAREPWVVEESAARSGDRVVVRFRHELGYEVLAAVGGGLDSVCDGELVDALEAARNRRPGGVPDAA